MPVRDDGDFVDQVSAVKAWAQAATDVLVESAAQQQTVEYQRLAREVQQRSGIHTKQPTSKWISPLLGVIARQCSAKQLPLMTALVVRRDGTVGPAYDEILRFARIPFVAADREEHAQQQREACYRRWRGASPAAPTSTANPRAQVVGKAPARTAAAARAAKKEPLQGNVCPTCFVQMSLTGVCDNCD